MRIVARMAEEEVVRVTKFDAVISKQSPTEGLFMDVRPLHSWLDSWMQFSRVLLV